MSSKMQARQLFKLETDNAKTVPASTLYSQDYKMKRAASETNFPFKSKLYRFRERTAEVPPVGYYQWDKKKPKQPSFNYEAQKPKKEGIRNHSKYVEKLIGNDP